MVVLPDDSGPKISMMRPRGMPPTPSAMSSASEPVGTNCMSSLTGWSPRRMTLPLPNWRSICVTAASRALSLSKVALLSCSGRGKVCYGSVHCTGPFQVATIQDHPDDTKCADVHVLQGKRVTGTAESGHRDVRQPGPLLGLVEAFGREPGRHLGLQPAQGPRRVVQLERHDPPLAVRRQEQRLLEAAFGTPPDDPAENALQVGNARGVD